MSTTTNLGLFKHDNVLTNKDPFDLQKSINDNLDKIDAGIGSDRTRISKNETDISSIKKEQTAQDTNIETLTQRLNEKDNQIAELEDKVSDLNNNQIYGKASGEYVHLSDSAKMNCDIAVLGNSRQETREGYNLFNTDKITENKYIEMSNGILFDTSLTNTSDYIEIKANETYIFVYKYSTLLNESNRGYCMFDTDKNYISGNGYAVKDKKIIFNPTQDGYIRISFDKNCTDIMFYKGTDDKPYEPFGAMPSIDYPSEIEVVGDNKNLLQNTATSQTINGITFTVNEDGTVTVNGTATANTSLVINNREFSLAAGVYTISGCPAGGGTTTYRIDLYKSDWSGICNEIGNGRQITLEENIENAIVAIVIKEGTTVDNLVFKPKIEKGKVATTYSPYGMGSAKIGICNKNFLNTPYNSENKLTDTSTSDGYYVITDFKAYLIAGKTYRFKCETSLKFGFASDGGEGLCYLMLNKQANTIFQLLSNDRTITVKESGWYYLRYDIYKANKTASFWNFQIEEGTTATDYIAHEEQNYPVDMQEPFRAINDVQDCFVLKEDGKWYERHNILREIFKGNDDEGWVYRDSDKLIANEILRNSAIIPTSNDDKAQILCNYFKVVKRSNQEFQTGVISMNTFGSICIYNDINSLANFKTLIADLYNTGTPLYVDYVLKEPIDIECTEQQTQQLQQLVKAKTYKNVTNITTDTIAVLDVDYKRDLETYQKQQDDRITAIEQLLSTTTTSAMLLDNVQTDLESEVK